ncbi:hypothetical protein D3C86_1008930 [compost metagenome]
MHVDPPGLAGLGPLPGQGEGACLSLDRFLGQTQHRLIGAQRQIGVGDLGHERELGRHPGLLLGQIGGQGLIVQAADPPPEIQLPGRNRPGCLVGAGDLGRSGRREIGRRALRCRRHHAVQLRQEVGAPHAIGRPRRLDVEGRNADVAVVVEGGLDQGLQDGILEEVAPADIGGRAGKGDRDRRTIGAPGRKGAFNGRRRALIGRRQGAAAHEGEGRQCRSMTRQPGGMSASGAQDAASKRSGGRNSRHGDP